MVIKIEPDLEAALAEQAKQQQQGVAPEDLAVRALRDRFLAKTMRVPRDDWERRLREIATDCGVSLSNQAVSSEGIYD
jgi:hypothetical protein